MKKLFVLRSSDGDVYIDGPFSEEELTVRLHKDYDGCEPPKFADQMPTGELAYLRDRLVVFWGEVMTPELTPVAYHYRIPKGAGP
jgi:hypothetical protein